MKTHHSIQQTFDGIDRRLRHIESRLNEGQEAKLDWYDAQVICQELHFSKRTLAHYREAGLVPYSKIGGKIFYRLADFENCLTAHMVRKEPKP